MLAGASFVGVILFQRRHELLGDVIMRADCAMYQTKIQGATSSLSGLIGASSESSLL